MTQYNRIKMEDNKYYKESSYRVVRLPLAGYGMTVPERMPEGGVRCRSIRYEKIEFGGKSYLCAKDHQDRVIYIDTHAMEEAIESSCRCGEDPCGRHGAEISTPDSNDET
jgi:hypothetical protein